MARRFIATLFALAALLGLAAAPASAGQLAGIQTHVLWGHVDDAEMNRHLDLVEASGAGIMRVDVGWASLQQGGPDGWSSWYLGKIDRVVAAADARGIKLLMTLMNTPCWASTAPESLKQGCDGAWWERGVTAYAPQHPGAYARALAFLVARYGERVEAWEVWNEPNHAEFWKAADPAAAYAELLKAAYRAAKAADPSAYVIGGSLSLSDHAFARRLYALGVKGSFDAFSVHPYSDDVSPLDPRSTVDPMYSFVRGVKTIRDVMLAHGDSSPLWLTESGWSTATVRTPEAWRNGVSEETQARFMREQAQQVARWPWVEATVWFNLLDAGSDRADKWSNCGLVRVDGTQKPSWTAFRDVAAALQTGTVTSPPAPVVAAPPVTAPAPAVTPAASQHAAKRRAAKRRAAKRRAAKRRAIARRAAKRRAAARRARH
jgi:polysaccharide biosynthesis protein PslG